MISASNAFAISALLYTIPLMLIMAYQTVQPEYYVPGTYTFNSTMQVLLNATDYAAGLGALLCISGCVLWAAGKK